MTKFLPEHRSSNQNLKKIVQETVDGEVVSTHTTEIKRQA